MFFLRNVISHCTKLDTIGRNIGQDGGRACAFRLQWRPNDARKYMQVFKISII